MLEPAVHCWAASDVGVCMLADGHEGQHNFVPIENVEVHPTGVSVEPKRWWLPKFLVASIATIGIGLTLAGDSLARCCGGFRHHRGERGHRIHLLHRR